MSANRALVIGGGIAGMCAARVLADVYSKVLVVEKDRYPAGIGDRRGVPQSRMFHTLIERGRREIEALFPGFHALLDQRRAPRVAFGFNAALLTPRGWGSPARSAVQRGLYVSRTLLESTLRELFRQTPNVEICEEAEATRLIAESRDGRLACRGAEIRRRSTGESFQVDADLVVDASGGQTRSPQWLAQLGLSPPEEEELDPGLTYGGQWMRMRKDANWPSRWWWTHGVFIQRVPPHDINGGHLMRQEDNLWLLTLVAGAGRAPPMDARGITTFAASLRTPLISQMLPLFEPVSKMTGYRLSKNRWRHYERWKASLDGFIALGDAACVFNPNQGQGMSVAAAEAGILRRCIRRTVSPSELPRLFFHEQARFQVNPWRIAVANDLRFASVEGARTAGVRAFNWYRHHLAQSSDRQVQQHIAEIELLLKPVGALFDPRIGARAALSRAMSSLRFGLRGEELFGPVPPSLPNQT